MIEQASFENKGFMETDGFAALIMTMMDFIF